MPTLAPSAPERADSGGDGYGGRFARLWLAQGLSDLGDGLTLAAGPLLMTTLTHDAVLIGGVAGVQQAPVLLFGLFGGVVVDRVDPRLLVMVTDTLRGVLMALLAVGLGVGLLTGTTGALLVYLAVFCLGAGDCLVRPASLALLPQLVPAHRLAGANARLQATTTVGAMFIAPPVGALIFVAARPLPFAADAVSFAIGAALLAGLPRGLRAVPATERTSFRADVTAGMRWLWSHSRLRALALVMVVMNLTLGGVIATLVIYSGRRLHTSAVGYGALLACIAVGSVLGSLLAGRLRRLAGAGRLLAVGMLVETATHLSLALAHGPIVAGVVLAVFGVHDGIWGVVTSTVRQQLIPEQMRGRIQSAYLTFAVGGHALGGFLGGALVALAGATAPVWFAFVTMSALSVFAVPFLWTAAWPRDEVAARD